MIRILLISVLLFLTGFHANAQFVGEVHISEFKILILQKRRIIPPATADNGHFLYASAGIGHIVSKVYSDWTSGDARLGPDWCAGYDWIGKKRFGAGLLYSGFTSTGKTNTTYGNFKQRFLLNYIAPQFAYRIRQSKWAFGGRAGIGLAIYTDRIPATAPLVTTGHYLARPSADSATTWVSSRNMKLPGNYGSAVD